MKLTLEVDSQIISIEREDVAYGPSIHGLIVGLIAPALRAAGYMDVTLDEVLNHDPDWGFDELSGSELQ
jgi:hypothetical protein